MPFLPPNQQRQSTEGKQTTNKRRNKVRIVDKEDEQTAGRTRQSWRRVGSVSGLSRRGWVGGGGGGGWKMSDSDQ